MTTETENLRVIHRLSETKTFSMEEAQNLIPLLKMITTKTKKQLQILQSQLSCVKSQSEKAVQLQDQMMVTQQAWTDKMRRLGVIPVALFRVRIPIEGSYVFWDSNETKLVNH